MDDLGVPLFLETPICWSSLWFYTPNAHTEKHSFDMKNTQALVLGKLDKIGLRTDILYICIMFWWSMLAEWILNEMKLNHGLPTVDASPCNLVYSKKLF